MFQSGRMRTGVRVRPVTLGGVTFVAVPIGVADAGDLGGALSRAAVAVRDGADLIEWRLDTIAGSSAGRDAASRLLDASVIPCIVTARGAAEGGGCELDDEAYAAWVSDMAAMPSPPQWIDIEYAKWSRSDAVRMAGAAARDSGTRVLCSFHDFESRPADLISKAEAMQREACDAVKLVWRARSIRDCLECRDLLAHSSQPMIALCMGSAGLMSRVMAGAWGAMATFASADSDAATAPGQPTIGELQGQWRFNSIDRETVLTGLVGDPLGHSPGFVLHNRAYDAGGINAVYLPLPVAAGWEPLKASLATLIDGMPGRFRGVSVTIPHKLNALRFVRERGGTISSIAEACGAANTITVTRDGSIHADNTDTRGVIEPLEAMGAMISGGRAAVLGAGGVARAAAAALRLQGAAVHVFNRSRERATTLVTDLAEHKTCSGSGSIQLGEDSDGPFDVIVQATSVGMEKGDAAGQQIFDALGLDAEAMLASQPAMLETVYEPVETAFVQAGREAGCQVATGVDMWLAQAAAQQDIWSAAGQARR